MSDTCLNCGRLIMQPEVAYRYAGPVCRCPIHPHHQYQRPASLEPDVVGQQIAYKAWAHVRAENKWKELEEKLTTANEQLRIAREALEAMLVSHFNLYKSTFGETSNPEDDLIRIQAREALAKISEGEK